MSDDKSSHVIAANACLASVRIQENIKDFFDGKMSLDAMTANNSAQVSSIDKLNEYIDGVERDLEEARKHVNVMLSIANAYKDKDDNASVFINVSRCRDALRFAERMGWWRG